MVLFCITKNRIKKIIIYLACLFANLSFAQAQSSSEKEQYAQFITSYFAAPKPESGWYKLQLVSTKREVNKQEIQFLENNSKMIFYEKINFSLLQKNKLSHSCLKIRHIIDFKTIDQVYVLGKSLSLGKNHEICLVFRSKGENIRTFTANAENDHDEHQCEKTVSPFKATFAKYANIIINYGVTDRQGNLPYDKKLLHAFEQLIKLNGGAPNPTKKCFEFVLSTKTN